MGGWGFLDWVGMYLPEAAPVMKAVPFRRDAIVPEMLLRLVRREIGMPSVNDLGIL